MLYPVKYSTLSDLNCITRLPVKDEILGELHDANVVVEVERVVVLVHDHA